MANKGVHKASDTVADYYTGTRRDLVEAGVCKPEWFPGNLVREFRKDGRPNIGNNGKQRTKRTYRVERQESETILTHRRDSEGKEYWIVRIAVNDEERAKREAAERERWAEYKRQQAERQREEAIKHAQEELAAQPIVEQLRLRYPDLRIRGRIEQREKGKLQFLDFYGRSIEQIRQCGLLRAEIAKAVRNLDERESYVSGELGNGESYYLSLSDTYCLLSLRTWGIVRERRDIPRHDAKAILKRIAQKARTASR